MAVVVAEPDLRASVAKIFDGAPQNWIVRMFESAPADADVVVAAGDIPGAVAFDPDEPSRLLSDIAGALGQTGGRCVVVTGPGGSGCTTLAMGLARAFTRSNSTVLLDLDRRWSGATDTCGLPPDVRTWAHAGDGPDEMRLAALPVAGGYRILAAPRTPSDMDLVALIERARANFEVVVVDAPGSQDPLPFLEKADAGVVVLDETKTSAHRTVHLLVGAPDIDLAVVTNRTRPRSRLSGAVVQEIVGLPVSLRLPYSPSLDGGSGRPDLTWSRWGRAVTRLARALERTWF